ncbi:hypothetical protein A5906_16955 [Bradyrhizobium sacchari]|nr:hypothetical protein A5906_16955 [Bradyrhizobium sacchari]
MRWIKGSKSQGLVDLRERRTNLSQLLMDAPWPWESLDERAGRAIAQARLLVEDRRALMEDLTFQYRRRFEAAQRAVLGVRKIETRLVTNYNIWLGQIPSSKSSRVNRLRSQE